MSEKKTDAEIILQHVVDLIGVNSEGLTTDEETIGLIIEWLVLTGWIESD